MDSTHAELPREDTRQEAWAVIHENLIRLSLRRGATDVEEARWLMAGLKHRVHEPLGFGSFLEYVERVLGYTPKKAAERIRVAQAFAELPALCDSVRRGELCWSAAREISRVAVPETVDSWIEECRDERVRDVERFVSGRKPGDLPTSPPDESVRTHVVRFEVRGDTLSLLRSAQTAITRDAEGHVTDDQLVRLLARAVLDGGADPGRAAYQLVVHECPSCGRAHAEGGGELVAVDETVAEMARCDAQEVHVEAGASGRAVSQPHLGDDAPPDGSAAPHLGDDAPPDGSAAPHTGATPDAAKRPRATQTIPPAIRRAIVRRHHGRCAVRGCRHVAYVHQHHVIRRADGGQHDPERMLLLCEGHHVAVHEGFLVIEGTWSTGFRFHHADGTPYGRRRREVPDENAAASAGFSSITRQSRLAAATRHLRGCGVPEHEAAALVRSVADELAGDDSLPAVVDAALRRWVN